MKNLWGTLKRGLILLFVFTGLAVFIAKNCYELYVLTPKISSSVIANTTIYSILILLSALTLGHLSNRISLFVNVFFRKLGNEAFLVLNNEERVYPMITAGEIKIGENIYFVCYRASILWVLSMPAEFVKKSSPCLIITKRSAVSALFSAAQYYKDQNNPARKI